jgi:AcrR family transcriptional regulator
MPGVITPAADRSLPLRERKKLRTRRALADAALRLFASNGFGRTTLEDVAAEAEVSKSTFFRFFPAKEAAAIEAEAELWTAYLTALAGRELSGAILGELHQTLAAAAAGLDPGWDDRFLATRRLIAGEPALLAYVEHYRAGVERQVTECLSGKLGLDPEDLRLLVLAELATTAFSVAGRHWVRHGGRGGREALLDRLDGAVRAIPASLDLSARPLLRRAGVGVGDDLPQDGRVGAEGPAPGRAEPQVSAAAAAGAGLAHGHVAGLFQDGDLLGQRRVAQAQAVPREGEVGPVGRGQQGDDREPRRRVDQLVEPRLDALRRIAHQRAASSRRAVICCATGSPAAYAPAISSPASVLGSGAPAAPSAIRAST